MLLCVESTKRVQKATCRAGIEESAGVEGTDLWAQWGKERVGWIESGADIVFTTTCETAGGKLLVAGRLPQLGAVMTWGWDNSEEEGSRGRGCVYLWLVHHAEMVRGVSRKHTAAIVG